MSPSSPRMSPAISTMFSCSVNRCVNDAEEGAGILHYVRALSGDRLRMRCGRMAAIGAKRTSASGQPNACPRTPANSFMTARVVGTASGRSRGIAVSSAPTALSRARRRSSSARTTRGTARVPAWTGPGQPSPRLPRLLRRPQKKGEAPLRNPDHRRRSCQTCGLLSPTVRARVVGEVVPTFSVSR